MITLAAVPPLDSFDAYVSAANEADEGDEEATKPSDDITRDDDADDDDGVDRPLIQQNEIEYKNRTRGL